MSKTGYTEKDDGDNGQASSTSPSLENEKARDGDVEAGTALGKTKVSVQTSIGR